MKGLSRNKIKYIAIAAMLIDHIAMTFLSSGIDKAGLGRVALYSVMRVIGRLTAPIMFFFLAEGFRYTSSRKKYALRLLCFGLVSQVPYALLHYNSLLKPDFNVIITLFVTFLMLAAAEGIKDHAENTVVVFALIMATFCCDWGVTGPFMAWLFYHFREDRKAQLKAFAIVCAIQVVSAAAFLGMNGYHWYGELWQAGMFLAIPVLLCYNGEAGSRAPVNKWVFYIFYPLHLAALWAIKMRL